MAQTIPNTTLPTDSTGPEVKELLEGVGEDVVESAGVKYLDDNSSSTLPVADTDSHAEKNPTGLQPNTQLSRPSLMPLVSSHPQASSLTPLAPHPKRFSAVNINKKFLEKNTAPGSTSSSSPSSTAKAGTPTVRPSIQPPSSHSRLVTAKLTGSPAVASSTAGWSRPSSVAPSPATASNSPNSTSPLPIPPAIQPSVPQLPHAGKVILPQPRTAALQTVSNKESGTTKPVWGNVKPPTSGLRPDMQPSDFPTAAEVANVASSIRKQIKLEDYKLTSDNAAKQLRLEEADTFRGVHLDPNAHHWDEMEEDDDNFLGGVIEFGDGRQYKIECVESQPLGASSIGGGLIGHSHDDESVARESSSVVSKEDRFVDDFDRSWPKSRNSPTPVSKEYPASSNAHPLSASVSPVISQPGHSPQDSSRVLFNERSNRLEPYSQSHRQGQGPFGVKRLSNETNEPKGTRDSLHNVQVLQKSASGEYSSRGRRFSSSSSGTYPSGGQLNGSANDRFHDREQSSRLPSGVSIDRGRKTTMGPPPLPAAAPQKSLHESTRPMPSPHLSQVPINLTNRRTSSRDSRLSPSEPSAILTPLATGRLPPQSPAISHTHVVSPSLGHATDLPLTAPELDVARKDVMHIAAERAKQRRQQEEEEREAQKERARRKAAELEEKMRESQKQNQSEGSEALNITKLEKEAITVIEQAVKSVELPANSEVNPVEENVSLRDNFSVKSSYQQASDSSRANPSRWDAALPPRPQPPTASSTTQTESWRVKTTSISSLPTSSLVAPLQIQARPPSATFVSVPSSAAEQVESIADGSKDDLEVVDFSELGKFIGVPDEAQNSRSNTTTLSKPLRPVASDFFDVSSEDISATKKADFGAWRRKVSQDINDPSISNDLKAAHVEKDEFVPTSQISLDHKKDNVIVPEHSYSPETSTKEPLSHVDQHLGGQAVQIPQTFHSQRAPRNQIFYKEANMSALDDAMSRIKGVLVGMQASDGSKENYSQLFLVDQELQTSRSLQSAHPPPQVALRPANKWIPPALRPRKLDDTDEPRQLSLVTVLEPYSLSPPSSPTVRLPSVSRPVEFISKKQLQAFFKPPSYPRLDILSFEPPVYDMNRRSLSLNDVLFRKPPTGKHLYRVLLPRHRGPKVNIPPTGQAKPNGVGAFGRPTVADGATTWRKLVTFSTTKLEATIIEAELSTMSRSPPPSSSPPETNVASIPKVALDSPTKTDNLILRPRTQPKMPSGTSVAFIRGSRIDVVEADTKPLVNFIVGSQLDDAAQSSQMATSPGPSFGLSNNEALTASVNGIISPSSDDRIPFVPAKAENSEMSSGDPIPITSTHASTSSWARTSSVNLVAKDVPARAPDPEHLKALWSQTSNKSGLHPVNSLEGIADDLTALPFTLQDVKSEDGETPPPLLPSAPSRMSLHEVTRAFQQVPTSSSSSNQSTRSTFSPPSTHAPVARPIPASYPYSPAPQASMRPAYVTYPSPMMSHSPTPVMYGHPMTSPVPSRMQVNGHTPLYSQPMWMTMPAAQTHGSMMRPVPSPYPSQMMTFASPPYTQPPPPNMMSATPQGQNGGRGRGMTVLSPVMSHAHPGSAMYSGSPVMLHAVQIPQNHGYLPIAGQGQPRTENAPQRQPSQTGFNPAAPSSFVRSAW